MPARLVTIPFSHYSEKARWALEHAGVPFIEEGHLPLFHIPYVKRAGGSRKVPVLKLSDRTITDSSSILLYADDVAGPGRKLLPADPALRAEILRLEKLFDDKLGPASRRWCYGYVLGSRTLLARLGQSPVPAWERTVFQLAKAPIAAAIRRGLNVTPEGVARSLVLLNVLFETVDARLADGRRYLAGDTFSAADLTLAALAAPALFPPQYPAPLPPLDELPDEGRRQLESWRASRTGRLVLRLYAQERTQVRRS